MKIPDILRRWLSQAEITAWEGLFIEMEKRQRDKEAELKSHVEAQGWRLHLGAEPFIALTSDLEIKPGGGDRFEKREPGGQWTRANPMRDFPQSDLAPLQKVSNLFVEATQLRQTAHELPAAIEEFNREYQRHLDAVRLASPAKQEEGLEQLRRFYERQKEALPLSTRKELLEMEFTILLDAFRGADSTQETENLREQLRDFFCKHRQSGTEKWEEVFIREDHQKEYRSRLEEMRQAASHEEIARDKEQLLVFANKYGNYLPGNPLLEIQEAWTHALENNIPPPSGGLRVSVGREEGINLSWTKCLGATQYQIYRSESSAPGSKSFLVSIPARATASSPNPTFLDSSAAENRDYFYWVKATNPKGESDFTGPAKGNWLKPAGLSREPWPQTAPPEVTVRMMKAMEEGDILEAIEIYTQNLAHAEIWVGMLDETLVICHENARSRKESEDAGAIAQMLGNHRTIQRKLRELIKADGNPTRIKTLTRISARNNDFVTELDEHLRNLNKQDADTKAKADSEAAAKTTAVENQQLQEQALAEIKARCDKAATWEDISAIKESFLLHHEWSQDEQFRGECQRLLQAAGKKVEEMAIGAGRGALADWAGVKEEQYVNLAIVFTDIIGSTRLNSRFGDAAWDEIRSAHFRQARRLVAKTNGWYIKDLGDAVVAVFKNAVDALNFAMELEKDPGHDKVRITAGAHIGTVIIRGNDIFGNEVNLAARIQDKAGEGGVWMSEGVRAEWRSRHGKHSLAFIRHPDLNLKGLDDPVTLWSLPSSLPPILPETGETETKQITQQGSPAGEKAQEHAGAGSHGEAPRRDSKAEAERIAEEARLAEEKAKTEAEATKRQLQSVLNQATAAALAGKIEEVRQLIKTHPDWRQYLEPHLKWAEQIKKEAEEAETLFQTVLSRAAAAAAAGKPGEVQQLIQSHPKRREDLEPHQRRAEQVKREAEAAERQLQTILSRAAAAAAAGKPEEVRQLIASHPHRRAVLEPHLRRAEQVKKDAEGGEHQPRHILSRATDAAVAGKPEEVRKLMEAHPDLREALEPHLRRAEQVQAEAEEAIRHIRQLQTVLTRAAAAAAAGKPEEVQVLMEKHAPFREQLIPHLHQAIQTQIQACAKQATTPQAIEALKELLQAHKGALKSQPMLVKTLESLLAETDARVLGEIKTKLLEEEVLAEARKRLAAANADEDVQLLDHWVDEQIARLPARNPALASELRELVTQAQRTLPKPKKSADQAGLDGWKHLALARSQAKKFAEEGDLDGVLSLIAANPRWELQLVSFLQEAVATRVRRQASHATKHADIVALEELIQQHRPLLEQNAELAAEFAEILQQARSAVKARFKRKMVTLFFILVSLAALGTAIGVMLSRPATK